MSNKAKYLEINRRMGVGGGRRGGRLGAGGPPAAWPSWEPLSFRTFASSAVDFPEMLI